MKKTMLLSAISSLAFAASVYAAPTLNLAVGVSASNGTATSAATSLNATAGQVINVYVFAQSAGALQDPASDSVLDNGGVGFGDETGLSAAGGVAGFQFNVVNNSGTNQVNYNTGGSATTFAQSAGFGTSSKPVRTTDGGGGFDAINGLFETSPGASSYSNTTLGTPDSSTVLTSGPFAGYDLIATEKWTVTTTPTVHTNVLSLAGVTGAIYYDSTDGAQNFLTNYPTVNNATASVIVPVPEPVSASLLGLGALSLAARRRRA